MNSDRPELILASQSPRRRELLRDHGFEFVVNAPHESVEQQYQEQRGVCSSCSPEELVLESAMVKAKAIAGQVSDGLILAADTVAECQAEILGKPVDREHAEKMFKLMRGKRHRVLTGVCLWHRPTDEYALHLEQTVLRMEAMTDAQVARLLDTDGWIGKAGGFGYQDGLDWLQIESGLESTVVGLPVERLNTWIDELMRRVEDPGE